MNILSPILKAERIQEYAKFFRLKEEWNRLLSRSGQNSPFFTHQWFDAWWKSFGKDKELKILLVRDERDDLIGLAPLMVSERGLFFMASQEVTDYCDFISLKKNREKFYQFLLGWLQKNSTDFSRMEFINIPEASPTLPGFFRLSSGYGFVCKRVESEVVPVASLPDSYEKYVKNLDRKKRHELRRKIRKLESEGPVHIDRITEPSRMSTAVREFISLHRECGPEKQDFWRKEGMSGFFQELASHFSREKWVEFYMLSIQGRLIGSLVNLLYEDRLSLYNAAYDRSFSSLSPGFYLFVQSIKQSIEEGKKKADFLRGSEKYKYFFGAKDSKIYTLTLSRKE